METYEQALRRALVAARRECPDINLAIFTFDRDIEAFGLLIDAVDAKDIEPTAFLKRLERWCKVYRARPPGFIPRILR